MPFFALYFSRSGCLLETQSIVSGAASDFPTTQRRPGAKDANIDWVFAGGWREPRVSQAPTQALVRAPPSQADRAAPGFRGRCAAAEYGGGRGRYRAGPARSPLPRVLTRLQGAEQPGRRPGDAAALLEHIAQDGAHATAAALPLQAFSPAPQGAAQLVLSHPRAPWAPAQPPSAFRPTAPPVQRLRARGPVSRRW